MLHVKTPTANTTALSLKTTEMANRVEDSKAGLSSFCTYIFVLVLLSLVGTGFLIFICSSTGHPELLVSAIIIGVTSIFWIWRESIIGKSVSHIPIVNARLENLEDALTRFNYNQELFHYNQELFHRTLIEILKTNSEKPETDNEAIFSLLETNNKTLERTNRYLDWICEVKKQEVELYNKSIQNQQN